MLLADKIPARCTRCQVDLGLHLTSWDAREAYQAHVRRVHGADSQRYGTDRSQEGT
jgi:uncharacterized protein (DUF885 family)